MKTLTFQQLFTRHLMLGIITIHLIVYAVAAFDLYQSRRFYEKQTEISTQNLAQTLETNISGILEKLNVALFSVTSEAERQIATGTLDGKALNIFMAEQLKVVPEFEGLWIADRHGFIHQGTQLPSGAPINITDREYFVRQSLHPDLGMVISKPVMGRITRDWSVLISRRINNPDGSFGGARRQTVGCQQPGAGRDISFHIARGKGAREGAIGSVSGRLRSLSAPGSEDAEEVQVFAGAI